jgi:aryl-alcohol dehydrogenase-like predicted oxidoreductase
MEYRCIGRSGLKASVIGLGCNNFGRRIDYKASKPVVHKALDLGITFFDTADRYGMGLSEQYLGKALGTRRKDVVIATKYGNRMGDGPYGIGASRRYITDAVEASLKRLGTDWIDLYQLHRPDPQTPIEETLEALTDLVRSGKVRYIGCSTFAAWQLVDAHWTAHSRNLAPFISAQNRYNLLDRTVEREFVPAAKQHEIGVIPYHPLENGLLTGKYKRGKKAPKGTRLGDSEALRDGTLTNANFDKLAVLEEFSRERSHSLIELALGWLASQPHVSTVIAGATKPTQVVENVAAGDWQLSPTELAELNSKIAAA